MPERRSAAEGATDGPTERCCGACLGRCERGLLVGAPCTPAHRARAPSRHGRWLPALAAHACSLMRAQRARADAQSSQKSARPACWRKADPTCWTWLREARSVTSVCACTSRCARAMPMRVWRGRRVRRARDALDPARSASSQEWGPRGLVRRGPVADRPSIRADRAQTRARDWWHAAAGPPPVQRRAAGPSPVQRRTGDAEALLALGHGKQLPRRGGRRVQDVPEDRTAQQPPLPLFSSA